MQCPKCDSEMETVTFEGIDVDRCTGCGGLWFDMLEQEDLRAIEGSEAIDTGDPRVGKRHNRSGPIHCPVCKARMIPMVDRKQPHIWYESCQSCFGVFFDAGEFSDYKNYTPADILRDLFARERRS